MFAGPELRGNTILVTETETGKDTVGGEKEMPLATESRTKAHRELAVTWTEMTWGLER